MKTSKSKPDQDVTEQPAASGETPAEAVGEAPLETGESGESGPAPDQTGDQSGDSVTQAARALLESWREEAQAAGAEYPGLDLDRELEDPRFLAMLCAGLGVKTAYEAVHLDEVKAAVARAAAREREKAITDDILARGARPAENGAGAQNALRSKIDVGRMTRAQRADVARRAALGEVITFRS